MSETTTGAVARTTKTARKLGTIVVLGSLLGLGSWAGVYWERQGHRSGNDGMLDRAVQAITQGIQGASETVGNGFSQAKDSARNQALAQQIETRIGQDKAIDAAQVMVAVEEEGTALLRGLVPDEKSRDKAVALTRDTRGVQRVIDQIAVVPEARVIDAPPAVPLVSEKDRVIR